MRKFFVFAAAALVVLAACNKNGNENAGNQQGGTPNTHLFAMPDWVINEDEQVPIELGQPGILTKGTPITTEIFNGPTFTYSVIAFNNTMVPGSQNSIMPGFAGGVLARNVVNGANTTNATGDDISNTVTTQFGTLSGNTWTAKTIYYPYMYVDGTFSFYGYRVDGTVAGHTLNAAGTGIDNVALGANDIIWAKAVPNTDLEDIATNAYGQERGYDMNTETGRRNAAAKGFSAKYIRGGVWAVTQNRNHPTATPARLVKYTDFLPNLDFAHLTTQIQFVVKAYDNRAQTTLSGANVLINSITLGDATTFYNTADFNIVDGTLTGNTHGTISVPGINGTNGATPFSITTTGADCGEPIFILPCTATAQSPLSVALNMSIRDTNGNVIQPLDVTATVTAPAVLEDPDDPNSAELYPAGTFVKGYKYTFTISLMSLEKIEITTSLAGWIDANNTGQSIVID